MMKVSIPSSVKYIGEYNFKGGKSMIWQIIDITILESKIVQIFFRLFDKYLEKKLLK